MVGKSEKGERGEAPGGRDAAVGDNRETVSSYEAYAGDYAVATAPGQGGTGSEALRLLVDTLGSGSTILEIGSGPGWDADFLEANGLPVRRTDATEAFLVLQRERGKAAHRLDLIDDELGGPYDGIVALYVLQHINRVLVPPVLGKIAAALRPGGAFLVSLREGAGDILDHGSQSRRYHVSLWSRSDFQERLAGVGLRVDFVASTTDDDGDWITLLARKQGAADAPPSSGKRPRRR